MTDLKQTLRTFREIGIPYASIAKLAGVDNSVISKYANGKTNSTPATEQKIADAIALFKEMVAVA